MSLPVNVVSIGNGHRFRRSMQIVSNLLPRLFQNLDRQRLKRAYVGVQKVRFVEKLEKGNVPYHYDVDEDVVSIYPLANSMFGRIDKAFYAAMGLRYFHNEVGNEQRLQWSRKLVFPRRATLDKIQRMLKRGEVRSFRKLVGHFKNPNDRLVALHIANALMKNSVRVATAKELNLKSFPATREFARSEKPYSLRPLLSVYGGRNLSYEQAFAEYCTGQGIIALSDSSTANAIVEVFQAVTFSS